jgi:hypothetical protein
MKGNNNRQRMKNGGAPSRGVGAVKYGSGGFIPPPAFPVDWIFPDPPPEAGSGRGGGVEGVLFAEILPWRKRCSNCAMRFF